MRLGKQRCTVLSLLKVTINHVLMHILKTKLCVKKYFEGTEKIFSPRHVIDAYEMFPGVESLVSVLELSTKYKLTNPTEL